MSKVRRITSPHRYCDSKEPRERTVCPICESLNIKRRSYTYDYKCMHCGWEGKSVIKKLI